MIFVIFVILTGMGELSESGFMGFRDLWDWEESGIGVPSYRR